MRQKRGVRAAVLPYLLLVSFGGCRVEQLSSPGRTEVLEIALAQPWGRTKEGGFLFSERHITAGTSFKSRNENLPFLVLGLW